MVLAQAAAGTGLLCTILLIATLIAFVVGVVEALGLKTFTGSRFGALVVAIILLIVYVVLC